MGCRCSVFAFALTDTNHLAMRPCSGHLEFSAEKLLLILDCVILNEAASRAENRSAEDFVPSRVWNRTSEDATVDPHKIPGSEAFFKLVRLNWDEAA